MKRKRKKKRKAQNLLLFLIVMNSSKLNAANATSKPFCEKPPLASKNRRRHPNCIFINHCIAVAGLPLRCCRRRCLAAAFAAAAVANCKTKYTPSPAPAPLKKSESSLLWTLKMCTCRVILNNFCMRYYTTTYYECLGTHFQAVSKQNRFEFPNCSRFLIPPPPPLQPLMKQAEALLFPKAKHNHDLWLMM